ncbi:hypothetical protein ACHAW6_005962 [Cyclotella cf. meneghiniana]
MFWNQSFKTTSSFPNGIDGLEWVSFLVSFVSIHRLLHWLEICTWARLIHSIMWCLMISSRPYSTLASLLKSWTKSAMN